jgi:hypothetical protein
MDGVFKVDYSKFVEANVFYMYDMILGRSYGGVLEYIEKE